MQFLTNRSVLTQFLSILIDYLTCLFRLDPNTVCVFCVQVSAAMTFELALMTTCSESLGSAAQDGGDAVDIGIGNTLCKSLYIS